MKRAIALLAFTPLHRQCAHHRLQSGLRLQRAKRCGRRAAAQWTTRLSDPITVTIQTNFENLNQANIIGGASSVTLETTDDGFNLVRDALLQDAANEADDAVVAALPSQNQFSANLSAGFSLSGEIAGTKANFKAIGFSGLDQAFGATDGTVLFNSGFAFDFNKDDAVAGIGHIGIMDPTLAFGQSFTVTDADLRALDLIGYEFASREPGAAARCLVGNGCGAKHLGGCRAATRDTHLASDRLSAVWLRK